MDTFDKLREITVNLLADVKAIKEAQQDTATLLQELKDMQILIYTKLQGDTLPIDSPTSSVEKLNRAPILRMTSPDGDTSGINKDVPWRDMFFSEGLNKNITVVLREKLKWNLITLVTHYPDDGRTYDIKLGGSDFTKDVENPEIYTLKLPNIEAESFVLDLNGNSVNFWNGISEIHIDTESEITVPEPEVEPPTPPKSGEAVVASPTFSFLKETEKKGFKLFVADDWWRECVFEIPEANADNTVTVNNLTDFWTNRQNSKIHKIRVKDLDCVEDLAVIGHNTVQHIEFETLSHFRCGGRAMVTADKFVRPKSKLNNVQPNVFAFGSHVLVDAPQISVSWAVLLWMNLPNQVLQNIYLQSDMINGVWPNSTEALIAGAPCWINDFHPAEYKKHGPYDLYSFDCGILCGRYANAGADILQSVAQWYHKNNPHGDIAHSMVINNMFGMLTRPLTGEQTLGDFKTRKYKLPITVQDSIGFGSDRHQAGSVSTWGTTNCSHLGANGTLLRRSVLSGRCGVSHGAGDENVIEENLFARTNPNDNKTYDINLYESDTKLAPDQVKAAAQTKDNVFVNKRLIAYGHTLTEENNTTIDPSQLTYKEFDINTAVLSAKLKVPIGVHDVDGYGGIWSNK